jgi:hypothetical protein
MGPAISDSDSFELAAGIRQRRVGEEGVVLRQRHAEVMVLNELGARVLELACEGKSYGQIIQQLLGEYRVERSMLAQDVAKYLGELLENGVIVSRSR